MVTDPIRGVLNIVDNAAKAHTYRVERETDAVAFYVFAHLATIKVKYDSVLGISVSTTASRLQHAPKISYGFGGTYTYDLPGETKLSGIGWSAQSSQASTGTNVDAITVPAYGAANLQLEYIARKSVSALPICSTRSTSSAARTTNLGAAPPALT